MRDSVLIIAEAGVNHGGSLTTALDLVDAGAAAGADVVKFQSFRSEQLVTRRAAKAAYQTANTGSDGAQLDMLKALELSVDDHMKIAARCKAQGIRFMSTAFDLDSLRLLTGLEMPAVKIPSGDITFGPMLLASARVGLPLLVSTGMATLAEIEGALSVIAFALTRDGEPSGSEDLVAARFSREGQDALERTVTLLHCTTDYPAQPGAVNLRAMDTLAQAFGLPVGYSDHTHGIAVSIGAAARGAKVIEKHFTLDRTSEGPDHAASLEPDELREMVMGIRTIEAALGSTTKGPQPAELANRVVARRSIVAKRHIAAGALLTAKDITAKRPADGVSPLLTWDILNRPAARDYEPDEALDL